MVGNPKRIIRYTAAVPPLCRCIDFDEVATQFKFLRYGPIQRPEPIRISRCIANQHTIDSNIDIVTGNPSCWEIVPYGSRDFNRITHCDCIHCNNFDIDRTVNLPIDGCTRFKIERSTIEFDIHGHRTKGHVSWHWIEYIERTILIRCNIGQEDTVKIDADGHISDWAIY